MALVVSVLELLAHVATFLGVIVALVVWRLDQRTLQEARENESYQALQDQYQSFLRLCFDNMELGILPFDLDATLELDEKQQRRRLLGLEMLVSMFEHAHFLRSRDHGQAFRDQQWPGWEHYMRYWAGRKVFRDAWIMHLRNDYESSFVAYMDEQVEDAASA